MIRRARWEDCLGARWLNRLVRWRWCWVLSVWRWSSSPADGWTGDDRCYRCYCTKVRGTRQVRMLLLACLPVCCMQVSERTGPFEVRNTVLVHLQHVLDGSVDGCSSLAKPMITHGSRTCVWVDCTKGTGVLPVRHAMPCLANDTTSHLECHRTLAQHMASPPPCPFALLTRRLASASFSSSLAIDELGHYQRLTD